MLKFLNGESNRCTLARVVMRAKRLLRSEGRLMGIDDLPELVPLGRLKEFRACQYDYGLHVRHQARLARA